MRISPANKAFGNSMPYLIRSIDPRIKLGWCINYCKNKGCSSSYCVLWIYKHFVCCFLAICCEYDVGICVFFFLCFCFYFIFFSTDGTVQLFSVQTETESFCRFARLFMVPRGGSPVIISWFFCFQNQNGLLRSPCRHASTPCRHASIHYLTCFLVSCAVLWTMQENTLKHADSSQNGLQSNLGVEPWSVSLWGNSCNHWFNLLPHSWW